MGAVRAAKHRIYATMDLKEELTHPLPPEYFSLLKKKQGGGIQITRIGFGTKSAFLKLSRKLTKTGAQGTFLRAQQGAYKRMLLVDGKVLLFAREKGGKRNYFLSRDPSMIKTYRKYFRSILGKSSSAPQ